MRLEFIAPGEAAGTRDLVFGDPGPLVATSPVPVRHPRQVFCAPEEACRQTAAALVDRVSGDPLGDAVLVPAFSGPDAGIWTGRTLAEVMESDAQTVMRWLSDPHARPEGGESFAEHLDRVARALDTTSWPEAGAIVVAPSFTLRAACLHALGAGPASIMHLDVAPLTVAVITHHGGTWRLRSIMPGHAAARQD